MLQKLETSREHGPFPDTVGAETLGRKAAAGALRPAGAEPHAGVPGTKGIFAEELPEVVWVHSPTATLPGDPVPAWDSTLSAGVTGRKPVNICSTG